MGVGVGDDQGAVAREEHGREIGPFAAILLRSESASSSQIEQHTASAKRVLMAEAGETTKRNASQIASNTAAMAAALAMADDTTPVERWSTACFVMTDSPEM